MTSALVDWSRLSVRDLLRLEAGVVTELRRRGLVRTNNKALGDIGEQVVLNARGGVLEPNSTKSHDITTADGRRIQVKAMAGRSAGAAAKFSPFRSLGYDTAVFLVFEPEGFEIAEAYEVPGDSIDQQISLSAHVNGRQPTLRQVRLLGVDVVSEMKAAYARLDDAASGDGVEFRLNV